MSSRRSALRAATSRHADDDTSSRASSPDSVLLAPLATAARKADSKERDTESPAPNAKTTSKRPLRTIDEDVIIISSDSEPEDERVLKHEKSLMQENERLRRQVEQLLARSHQQSQSDKGKKRFRGEDDEGDSVQLRKRLTKVAQDAALLQRKLDDSEKEVLHLKSQSISADGLREHLECEICMDTLWLPWALSECGHAFCQSCLINLFNDRKFTCPQCRVAVRRRPVEVYALKRTIRAIAGPAPPEVDMLADSQHVWDALWPRSPADPPAYTHAQVDPHAHVHAL